MKIAINKTGDSFTERWIKYCSVNNIPFKIVNSYKNDIIRQLDDCDAFMWHHSHMNSKDVLFAKQLLYSIELSGKVVFPEFKSNWHFDDKVGQKYLLESLNINSVSSYVFYTKADAITWANTTSFPKVFKLRGGSGSSQVKLAKTKKEAFRFINKAFEEGFSQYDKFSNLKERYRKYRLGKTTLFNLLKGIARIFYTTNLAVIKGNERGYVYFQDFVESNDSDYRVIVIGNRAFAIKRMVRENDFRASGSGNILYSKSEFEDSLIKESFINAEKLETKCVAFDYVVRENKYLIIEISYGFNAIGYDLCEGYWDKDLNWHKGLFDPTGWMVETVIESVKNNRKVSQG